MTKLIGTNPSTQDIDMKKWITMQTKRASAPTSIYWDVDVMEDPCFLTFCRSLSRPFALITDSNLEKPYGRPLFEVIKKGGCSVTFHTFKAGEKSKNREVKAQLEDALFGVGHRRDSCLIALGGGVTTDLVGYTAATFCRGIPYFSIPTSLLAMVDASLGGKTGVNLPLGKNLIGLNYSPLAVFIDFSTLKTLAEYQMREGLAEIIKHSLISDSKLFYQICTSLERWRARESLFIKELVYKSCQLKTGIVAFDMEEKGRRRILNFGHTIGHAIEVLEGYHIPHGEAIAIGMVVESLISYKLKKITANDFDTIYSLFRSIGYQLTFSDKITTQKMLDTMRFDKKAKQCIPRFVILDHVGKAKPLQGTYSMQIDPPLLLEVLRWMVAEFSRKAYATIPD